MPRKLKKITSNGYMTDTGRRALIRGRYLTKKKLDLESKFRSKKGSSKSYEKFVQEQAAYAKKRKGMLLASGKDMGPNPKLKFKIKKGPITKGEIAKETIKGLPKAAVKVGKAIGRGFIGVSSLRRRIPKRGRRPIKRIKKR